MTAEQIRKPRLAWRRELLQLIVILLLLGSFRASFANHYQVPSGSMQPTLMPGDRVVVDMLSYGLRVPMTLIRLWPGRAPARGEVVIFDSPVDGTRLVKRVVAVGGDQVELRQGYLIVNGLMLTDGVASQEHIGPRTVHLDLDAGGGPDIPPRIIPPGQLLVLGDHRGASLDGRFFGLVAQSDVYGRALGVFYRRGDGFGWRSL